MIELTESTHKKYHNQLHGLIEKEGVLEMIQI